MRSTKHVGLFPEGQALRIEAQWPREDGILYQTSDFSGSTFGLTVYDLSVSNSHTAVLDTTRSISSVLTNSPGSWSYDSTGKNFDDYVGTNEVAFEGGHSYQIEYVGTRLDGSGNQRLAFIARCEPGRGV